MSKVIKLKKGLDIKLNGKAEKVLVKSNKAKVCAIKPTDFLNITPRLAVKSDFVVKTGDVLFADKKNPRIVFTSPVSGIVKAINRGERRKLLEIVIQCDEKNEFKDFGKANVNSLKREDIISKLLDSGIWPSIIQRPYAIVADTEVTPKAVFVSGFDSAPLAPDYEFILKDRKDDLQTGFDCLKQLCGKNVNVGLRDSISIFSNFKNIEINYFSGPHPAGNTGVQIHHISPINKGEHVWTVNIQDVAMIGHLFNTGKYNPEKIIAVTGSEIKKPAYIKTFTGASVASLLENNLKGECDERIILGNVLTGEKTNEEGYIGYYTNQICVIPEGNHYEFLGWMVPGFDRFSATKMFPSFLTPKKHYSLDTNLHGERRAFVITGQYEKVFPMDIYPVYLLKAMLAEDIDKMEQLGIYEVAPEDFALCEFVCTSKIPVQKIVRQGLDLVMKETN